MSEGGEPPESFHHEAPAGIRSMAFEEQGLAHELQRNGIKGLVR